MRRNSKEEGYRSEEGVSWTALLFELSKRPSIKQGEKKKEQTSKIIPPKREKVC
jgi:hypothetical protein